MLETVLDIGKVLRASPTGLKHHRFIKPAPTPDEKRNPVRFWSVPVNEDGSFSFSQISPLNNENKQKHVFYLNYKQSDADSTKPYLFGDIYRTITKTGEDGNFRFGDPAKKSWMALNSFQRAENITALATDRVKAFRASFRQQMHEIETFLRGNPNVYIHFDFGDKGWHELEEVRFLNEGLLNTFFDSTEHGYIARAFLYKTLGTGASNTPDFQEAGRYKTRLFTDKEQALDLIYGVNFASRSAFRVRDVKIVVLPRGQGLTAEQIERFFDRSGASSSGDADAEIQDEVEKKDQQNDKEGVDALFAVLADDPQTREIAQFDFVFSIAGGTKADIDLVELAGLERSKLSQVRDRISKIRRSVEEERDAFLLRLYGKPPKNPLEGLSITRSFLNILSNKTSKEKKYQNHLYKVLPQIYVGSYYRDTTLLPAFIERTEANIRSDAENFNLLKFDFYFLIRLQNTNEGKRLMQIQNSPSYRIGLLLGTLGRGLRTKINSFDKNYAGLLSRRIGTINDVMSLQNEFNQKLIMHDRVGWSFKFSDELTSEIKTFAGAYNKDECAFGFFESYFAPRKREEDQDDNAEPVQA